MQKSNRKPLYSAISMALTSSVMTAAMFAPAYADDDSVELEEVIVTATKQARSLQDIPVSVQVLGNQKLQDLQVKGFEDYMMYMPTVSFTTAGPGFGQVYMRGISSGGDGVHSGSMPSVGVYLDEQPVTTINQILDIHVYDIARIETLSGPQGTLYGQGSQSGTIRIITNKPEIGVKEGGYDIDINTVKSGDIGYGFDGYTNIPINDRMAIRLVGWYQETGGYIDNVPGQIEYAASGIVKTNDGLVKENVNDNTKYGVRALLKIDLNDNWTLTPGIMYQKSKSDGYWGQNTAIDQDLASVRFFDEFADEDWYQASLTLEGSIGDLDFVYAGAYLDRNLDSMYDYSGYAEYLEDLYGYYGYYCLYYDALGGCADGSQFVDGDENFNRMSHEVRISSSQDQRFRWVAGFFYQRQEHLFDLQWVVPDMNPADSVVQNGVTTWQTHQQRIDRDTAFFGEGYFDITEDLTLIGGLRWFEYENSLFGFNGFLRHCTGFYDTNGDFVEDADGEPQFPCFDTGILDDVSKGNDWAFKGSLEYRVNPDAMIYLTYSEGFRAGGVNRARVPGIPKYEPDWVINYEFGWKTSWMDNRLRFNGAAYIVDWQDFQFGFLDFTVSNLTIIQNVGESRTKGVEWDLSYAATEDLTLSFSGSYNDAKLQENFWRSDDDRLAGEPPTAPKGTLMPYVPELQLTAIGRMNFNVGDMPAFGQMAVSYTGSAWNNLDVAIRQKMDAYTLLNMTAGIEKENWTLTFYANNLLDERGQVDILDPGYFSPSGIDYNENIIRPRTFGVRWAQRFR
jgi:outer membrane receptor protein involved in Fe transport